MGEVASHFRSESNMLFTPTDVQGGLQSSSVPHLHLGSEGEITQLIEDSVPSGSQPASACSSTWVMDCNRMATTTQTLPADITTMLTEQPLSNSVEQAELIARAGMRMADEGRQHEALTLAGQDYV